MTQVLAPASTAGDGPAGERAVRAARRGRRAAFLLLCLVLYQAFHYTEHTIETVQLKFLGHEHAHTLLSGVDFEWVHLAANAVLEYGLLAVLVVAGAAVRRRWRSVHRRGWAALVLATALQGTHVVDHVVRAVQYVQSGGEPPTGTVTRWVDSVWFHFTMNLVVLVAMVVAFVGLRAWRELTSRQGRQGRYPPFERSASPAA